MGNDAGFGDLVHVGGADLHLNLLVVQFPESRSGVGALVAIGFVGGHIFPEADGDDGEGGVNWR